MSLRDYFLFVIPVKPVPLTVNPVQDEPVLDTGRGIQWWERGVTLESFDRAQDKVHERFTPSLSRGLVPPPQDEILHGVHPEQSVRVQNDSIICDLAITVYKNQI